MKKGFDRLKGVAAASAMGFGLLAAGSGRAATVTIPTSSNSVADFSVKRGSALWSDIANNTNSGSTSTGSSYTTVTSAVGTKSFVYGGSSTLAFGISDARMITSTNPSGSTSSGAPTTTYSGPGDAFDNALWLAVGQNFFANPDATVDLTADTLTTDTVVDIVAGIDAEIQYYFHPTRQVVRALYTLTNTTGADIDTDVRVGGNLGSDDSTTVQATSDGDLDIEATDLWHLTNDNSVVGGDGSDPGLTITRCGSGAPVCPQSGVVLGDNEYDDFVNFYSITVPANGTASVLVFIEMGILSAGLDTDATDFETLAAADAAGLLTGLTDDQLSTLVNYDASAYSTPPTTPTTPTAPAASDSSSTLSMGLSGLLAMLSMLPVLRLLRKKR